MIPASYGQKGIEQAAVIMPIDAGPDAREKQVRALGVTEFLAKESSLHQLEAALHPVLRPPDWDKSKSARRA